MFLPVKSDAVGLDVSLAESILRKSEAKSEGMDENVSLDK